MGDLFKIDGEPTFKATVQIPVPGGDDRPLEVEFKWLTAQEFGEKCKGTEGKDDAAFFAELVVRWSADADCNEDALRRLFAKYPNAARRMFETYRRELFEAEEKN